MVSTLYQDFIPLPGSTVLISFAHRGRAGVDSLSVEIGPSGTGPFTVLDTFYAGNTIWKLDTASYTFPLTASGTYSIRFNSVYAAGGPTVGNFLDAISIELPRPILNYSVTEPSCTDSTAGSITLNVTGASAPYSYLWSTGTSTTNALTGLSQGSYSVVVSDLYGCTSSSSFFLMGVPVLSMSVTQQDPSCFGFTNGSINISINNGTPPYSVLWNQTGVSGLSPSGLASGTYVYTVRDGSFCTLTDTLVLSQPPPLQIQAAAFPDSVCPGDTAYCSVSGASYYLWSTGVNSNFIPVLPLADTYYSVTGMDNSGCTATATVLVSVKSAPFVSLEQDTVCAASVFSPQASFSSTGGAISNLYWDFGDGNTSSGLSVSHTYLTAGYFTIRCTAIGSNGCTASSDAGVKVYPLPQASFVSSDSVVCEGSLVEFLDVSTSPEDPLVFRQWLPASLGNLPVASFVSSVPGTYPIGLRVNTLHGCTDDSDSALYITVTKSPRAGFQVSDSLLSEYSATVEFADESEYAADYFWDFGDGSYAAIPEPSHSYSSTGIYEVVQVVMSSEGCYDTLRRTLEVRPESMIWFPNTFTPNLDGKNESFLPVSYRTEILLLEVYNRWGELIHREEAPVYGWFGKSGEEDSPEGTYDYRTVYRKDGDEIKTVFGRVVLLR
jgi:gliding motility-associated-like protein